MPHLTIWFCYYAWGGDRNEWNPWGELFDTHCDPAFDGN